MSTVILQVLERDLPELPPRAVDIIEELRDPNHIDRDVLVKLINECGSLGDVVLRVMNSGYLSQVRRARSIEDAILLVGLESTRNIILGVLLKSLFPKRHILENFNRNDFLRHCLGTAVAAQMLYAASGLNAEHDPYKLVTYGFIHDIGVLALDYCMPVTLNRIFKIATEENMPILEAEVKVLGRYTHSVIGEWVCNKWQLPEDICNVVKHHHAPRRAVVNKQKLVLIHIADTISFNYYETLMESTHIYGMDPSLVRSLGLSMKEIREVEAALPARVERAMEVLDVEYLDGVRLF